VISRGKTDKKLQEQIKPGANTTVASYNAGALRIGRRQHAALCIYELEIIYFITKNKVDPRSRPLPRLVHIDVISLMM
jgi:hypothetical protein